MVGHWLSAWEAPHLHLVPGGWSNFSNLVMILMTLLLHFNATRYLVKCSEKVVVPSVVVQFGTYRWVHHPIYAFVMLLFATYCTALSAAFSLLFLVAICCVYYDRKVRLEEDFIIETFGDGALLEDMGWKHAAGLELLEFLCSPGLFLLVFVFRS